MDKMKMETANIALENLRKLKEMFPEVITETRDENGEIVAAVDAKKLENILSTKVIESDECYDFTWVGKKQAMIEACTPIRKTLRPCRKESVNWENTKNLYIEGDNLDVLKLLQESYLNKVKMIYIDPPYNTGKESFIYPDDYATNKNLYDEEVGAVDESGYRMFKNTDTNGRFHSSWCTMMYPRLKLARNLLTEDGVIFISIDDHEVDNLKKICTEVFGYDNVETMIWHKIGDGDAGAGRMKIVNRFRTEHEYIVIAYKDKQKVFFNKLKEVPNFKNEYTNPDNDPRGPYKAGNMSKTEEKSNPNGKNYYSITSPDGKNTYTRQWHYSKEEFEALLKDNRIYWGKSGNAVPSIKIFVNVAREVVPVSLLENVGSATSANKYMEELFGARIFNNPKPISLIYKLLFEATNQDSVILDFFSGSATTAHAVMQLNSEDGGKRKFIMVQLPEVCDKDSEAYKAGYKNISEIGKERIRIAGKIIVKESGKKELDVGFRVLKLDSSNMKDVYYTPDKITQSNLVDQIDNIKDGRDGDDLLYACMLEWGLELSLPHKVEKIDGFNVHIVNDGDLIACFDNNIKDEVIRKIAKMKPLRVVFRDSSFASDAKKTNMKEIFKLEFPELDNEGLKRKIKIL